MVTLNDEVPVYKSYYFFIGFVNQGWLIKMLASGMPLRGRFCRSVLYLLRYLLYNSVLKCVEVRRRPSVQISVAGDDQFVRGKIERPVKRIVEEQHQTRMKKYKNASEQA